MNCWSKSTSFLRPVPKNGPAFFIGVTPNLDLPFGVSKAWELVCEFAVTTKYPTLVCFSPSLRQLAIAGPMAQSSLAPKAFFVHQRFF
jgi:hypothetical protein